MSNTIGQGHPTFHKWPDSWCVARIEEVAAPSPGSTTIGPFGSSLVATDYRSEGTPVVFVRDVKENRFVWNSHVYIDDCKARQLGAHQVRPGDVIATKMGLPPCVASVYPEWMPIGVITADIVRLRPDLSKVLPQWVMLFINGDFVVRQVRAITAGVTRPKITLRDFRSLEIAYPSLPEQRNVVGILTTLDNLIEKTESLIAKYQAVKQGMMHDLFTRGVDAHGKLRPPQSEAPDLYKQSELGWIPNEWEAKRLGVALYEAGGFLQTGPFGSQLHSHEYVEDGVPVIMPQDINDGRISTASIARITIQKAHTMVRHRLRLKDVVFSRRGELSRAAALTSEEEGWICGTGCFLLRCPTGRIDSNWLAQQYRLPHVQTQVAARAVGSTMPSLNNSVMEGLLMLFPQHGEQVEICRRIDAIESSQRSLKGSLGKLGFTKAGLMRDLLTGMVRVKVNDTEVAVHA